MSIGLTVPELERHKTNMNTKEKHIIQQRTVDEWRSMGLDIIPPCSETRDMVIIAISNVVISQLIISWLDFIGVCKVI